MSNTATASSAGVAPASSVPLQQYYQRTLENVKLKLPELARELCAVGVVCVEVNYDGVGDSGQIESVLYFDKSHEVPFPKGHVSFTPEQVRDLFYDLLEARHPGWENDDGAFGDFRWDVGSGALAHTHHGRFTDYDTTEHEGV